MIKARIAVPKSASQGETIEIKTLVSHPMESGFRLDHSGEVIPRNIIERFELSYLGKLRFTTKFGPGIAANPYLSFMLEVTESGIIEFAWYEQNGDVTRESREIVVQ